MSKAGLIILIGFLILVIPFVGIPMVAKTALLVVLSAAVMVLGFLVREERRWLQRALGSEGRTDTYQENGREGYQHAAREAK